MIIVWWISGVVLFLTVTAGWAFFIEPCWFKLRKVTIPDLKKLKHPISILHLSDIHFVDKIGRKRDFFQKLSMLNPDLIVVTGDVIDCDGGIETAATHLSGLRARYGTFLVLGNHDYYDYRTKDNIFYHLMLQKRSHHRNDVDRFVRAMKKVGIRVLIDESAQLNVHGTEVLIGGTDDPVTRKVDFERALDGLSPKTFNILLMHQPDAILKLSHKGVDVAFSGHTHGGQIRIPFLGPIFCDSKLPRRSISGLSKFKETHLFVSQGLGAGRHLVPRLWCRPEAVLLELTSSATK
jgi:uncharacterized protein